jgi:pyruvate,orthophosphate dikinase
MNVPCIAGCSEIIVNEHKKEMIVGSKVYHEWDPISLDGGDGEFYEGALPVSDPELKGEFSELLVFADEFRKIDIFGNADTPKDAKVARDFGAKGIGLVRTEHMFFKAERILAVREMILAETTEARQKALDKLLPYQRDDFLGILDVMDGLPVVIRLIDPPLHEFLPREKKDIDELAKALGVAPSVVEAKSASMHEFNPMLGFRGCRLGVVYPEINRMQAQAIFEAAVTLAKKGKHPRPHIEIPLVGKLEEFLPLKK